MPLFLLFATCIFVASIQLAPIVTAKVPYSEVGTAAPAQTGGQTSWGLGVVIPQGSGLSGGGVVDWGIVDNVTAVVQIPDLTNVSAATYAVVSLMTGDGVVLQTAFGAFPGEANWLVYAMFITNLNKVPQQYTWAANASEPAAGPGDIVAISVFQTGQGVWSFKASNLNTSLSIQRSFGANTTAPPRNGDQEVLALESYASDSGMFEKMGNMTMISLQLNGRRVESGWYLFSDWDLVHNPLFVVGGAAPLPFVDLSLLEGGTAVWYYSGNWQGGIGGGDLEPAVETIAILSAVALVCVFLSLRHLARSGPSHGHVPGPAKDERQRGLSRTAHLCLRRWRAPCL